jgi:hypothetical protein
VAKRVNWIGLVCGAGLVLVAIMEKAAPAVLMLAGWLGLQIIVRAIQQNWLNALASVIVSVRRLRQRTVSLARAGQMKLDEAVRAAEARRP